MASTGIVAVRRWVRELGRDVERVTLCAELMTSSGEEVASWGAATTLVTPADPDSEQIIGFRDKGWTERVWELAQGDAEGRGQSTRYSVRAYSLDGNVRSKSYLQVSVTKSGADDEVKLDGSTASVIAQLQRGQADAIKAVMDMVKLTQASATNTNALITQLTGRLKEQEETISKLVDLRTSEKIEVGEQLAKLEDERRNATKSSNPFDDEFRKLVEMAAPHLVQGALEFASEKFGPALLEMFVSKPAAVATEVAKESVASNVVALAAKT